MVEVPVARLEIARQLRTARVAGAAGREPLRVIQGAHCRVRRGAVGVLQPPVDVRLHRPVACFTADTPLRHRGVVRVGRFVVVLPQARVVAGGALGVPVHAAPGPVPPLTGLSLLVAKDIEPFIVLGIVRKVDRLQQTSRELHKVLPQRRLADDPLHFKRLPLAGQPCCGDVKSTALGVHFRGHRRVFEFTLRLERPSIHCRLGESFGQLMVRPLPQAELIRMALATALGACVFWENLRFLLRLPWHAVALSLRALCLRKVHLVFGLRFVCPKNNACHDHGNHYDNYAGATPGLSNGPFLRVFVRFRGFVFPLSHPHRV